MAGRFPSLPPLSPAEQALIDLIWRLQPVTVNDLLNAVNQNRARPIIRNTLQTQLRRMEGKGWLKQDNSKVVRRYQSTIPEKAGRGRLLAEMANRIFGGSGVSMVRCLMEDGGLSHREIRELNQIIQDHQKGEKS